MKRLWKRLLIPIASGLFLLLIMIFIIYETIVSVLVLFNSQSQPAGYNLPPFVTDDMMQAVRGKVILQPQGKEFFT